jgi:L-alanine-DL-glutamate epimerase-like enolase superfamily enzyme
MLRTSQLANFGADAKHWIVNMRVSKMGGLLRSLEMLREVRRHNIRVIVGAHVGESSVLTRVALTVAASAGNLLVAQEGAFGTHLLSRDVVDKPLMFGFAGMLDVSALQLSGTPGFGLAISPALPCHER